MRRGTPNEAHPRGLLLEGYARPAHPAALRLRAADIPPAPEHRLCIQVAPGKRCEQRDGKHHGPWACACKSETTPGVRVSHRRTPQIRLGNAGGSCSVLHLQLAGRLQREVEKKGSLPPLGRQGGCGTERSDLSCSPVEEQGSQVKPLKSRSDALSPEPL